MNNFPDFSQHGYQIISQLGENHLGGRVTYLAQRQTDRVVIKQFQFAQQGATWAEYDAYSQEIAMLRQLNHPGIAKYLDSFQTADGFCMVQEYLDAESLASPRSWTPKQIKQIGVAVLEILVYLQSQNPPVIHRDIKPENILVDSQMQVYLVDFGFARMGGGEIGASSVVKGTMGFMPPEQLFNRQLTTASDLYGLGGTLICLLTGTKSVDIGNLIDADYRINFRHLVPPVKRGLINWLEKLTEPRLTHRYSSAAQALAALKTIDVDRLPKARFSHQTLEITATEFGKPVSKTITISNPIPDTVLSGRFSVAPHECDPPHTPYDHAWISFHPQQFSGNEVECEVTVDTTKLLAGETYTREVVLHSNSSSDSDSFTVQINTAAVPESKIISYSRLILIFVGALFGGLIVGNFPLILWIPGLTPFVVASQMTKWYKSKGLKADLHRSFNGACLFQIILLIFLIGADLAEASFILLLGVYFGASLGLRHNLNGCLIGAIVIGSLRLMLSGALGIFIIIFFFLFGSIFWGSARSHNNQEMRSRESVFIDFVTQGFGMTIGAIFATKSQLIIHSLYLSDQTMKNIISVALIPVFMTSIALVYGLIQQIYANHKIAKYRQSKSTLIHP
jgi:serine/threonine protein kinase